MNDVRLLLLVTALMASLITPTQADDVKAWEGTMTIPTYPWEDDVNPKFWAMEGPARLSTTVKGAITYPYTMQDHLSRTKVDRSYKALWLENEYLKVTCLPELGGRLFSVLDKTENKEMFHFNRVIKPSMIAMRGAFITGGVEWNPGPQVHTVTLVSPVDAVLGRNPDGSAFIEVNNIEKMFRTRWTVRVTLHPGRAYLDEQIRLSNPTDGVHPYYFWNCTAFPKRPGTRFIYPMTLGTDHNGREFFNWPVHEGKDLSWLKNYDAPASVFAVSCAFDFFGAYDVDADRGLVQVANHRVLPGKKAWTWGNSESGLVAQQNLGDEDVEYIEVQSGPLPTQSDYGMLAPRQQVAWQEWWYPVHGLGDGFEYATKDLAAQSRVVDGKTEVRLIATGDFPRSACTLVAEGHDPLAVPVHLSPGKPATIVYPGDGPVRVTVKAEGGATLAQFTTPLPIPKVSPPDPAKFVEKPDDQLSVEEKYLKGDKFDRGTNRLKARQYYEMALASDPGHVPSLRALAVLDIESGLYDQAAERLQKALDRYGDDGLAWYFLGVCRLREERFSEAADCGYQAAKHHGTRSLGLDLAGRGFMRLKQYGKALDAFRKAFRANPDDARARDHVLMALLAAGRRDEAREQSRLAARRDPTAIVPQAILALENGPAMNRFRDWSRDGLGEREFEIIETAWYFAECGLFNEAAKILTETMVNPVPDEPPPLVLYHVAWLLSRQSDQEFSSGELLRKAGSRWQDFAFPSRPEEVAVFEFALKKNPKDAHAHLHLGNLLANLGRLDEAAKHWQQAADLEPKLAMAHRNLGLYLSTMKSAHDQAAEHYRRAIAVRPSDQTLYRDLAEILIASQRRREAIQLLKEMPVEGQRRAEISIMLAQAYVDEQRYDDAIMLLESTPHFVNWEGQELPLVLFRKAHLTRGEQRFEKGDHAAALADFEAALTYPENIGVGRSHRPQEAHAEYWRGKALAALGRTDEARAAWQRGADGPRGSDDQNEHRELCRKALASLPGAP